MSQNFLSSIRVSPIRALLPAIVVIALSSCIKTIDLHLKDDAAKIVMNSLLAEDSAITVYLSNSIPVIGDGVIDSLSGANVELYQDGNFIENIVEKKQGIYISQVIAHSGHQYVLKGSHSGFASVQASSSIPGAVLPVEANYIFDGFLLGDGVGPLDGITLNFNDPPIQKNYYSISAYATDINEDVFFLDLITNDPLLNQNGQHLTGEYLLSDETFDGKKYATTIGINNFYSNNDTTISVFLVVKSVDKNYYDYFKTLPQSFNTEGDPFSEPVQVFNNIEGGLGIFAASNATVIQVR